MRFPGLLAAFALAAAAAGCTKPSLPEAEIPILGWYGITAHCLNEENFRIMKEGGFTITFSHLDSLKDVQKALALAGDCGMKVVLNCNELKDDPEGTAAAVKDHPALYAYYLQDEPKDGDIPVLAAWSERIRSVDDVHPLYINLFPNYVAESDLGATYPAYVRRFMEEIRPTVLSFDYYPVTEDGIRQTWWENLELLSRTARDAGIPLWAFALSTHHVIYPVPTLPALRLQMYTNLAYGAQCLEYFTYFNPAKGADNAPVTNDGVRTPNYYTVKEMNEELNARAGVFMGAQVLSVRHTGTPLPEGTEPPFLSHSGKYIPQGVTPLEKLPEGITRLDTGGYGAVVSELRNGPDNYLMLVNRSLTEAFDIQLGFASKVWNIGRDGSFSRVSKGDHTFRLEEGDCLIFRM